ncbi:MAG: YhcN/YlaJ family sporulation lipoprotein [Tumebacillaceae bacterium]
MKKVTALAGVLLLSSSLVAGCTQSATPNRTGNNYDTNNTGRVQDIGNRVGIRNIGPDARNLTTNTANNLRNDRSLEARVESIPGIKDATVLVVGNTAYVAINQGTNLQGKTGTTGLPGTTTYNRDRYQNNAIGGTYRGTAGTAGTAGTYGTNNGMTYGTYGTAGTYGTSGGVNTGTGIYGNAGAGNMTSYGANTYTGNTASTHPGSYSITNNGVYGTPNGIAGYGNSGAGIMSGTAGGSTYALDTNRNGYNNYYNAGTKTYGTAGTGGNTVAPYGTGTGTMLGTNPGVTGRAGTMAGGTGTTYDMTGRGTTSGTNRYGTMNNNATNYGTTTYGTDNVSADVKARVVAAVKQGNPAIQNVYVSANPALVNRFGAFVRDTATGHPLRGGNDLLDTLRRMFPVTR